MLKQTPRAVARTIIDETLVCFESSILRLFIPMLDFTVVCARSYAERCIFTIDAIPAMGMDAPQDQCATEIQGTATKLVA
jgi:hypothetical protein